ncbi:glycoside hydrolase family protein [Ochrobactrum teleogrylli]|uniref:Lysozyme n=1 Tax=Ochrobactrum teleogrylli TaxID=2479765 RepID=A0ABD5JSI7_9HYPH
MASKRAKGVLASGIGLVALTATYLTVPWEGVENKAYWDSLGKVWTVCAGETKGVKKGDYYSDAKCLQMLQTRLENETRWTGRTRERIVVRAFTMIWRRG